MYTMNFSQIGANIQKELDNKSMTQRALRMYFLSQST